MQDDVFVGSGAGEDAVEDDDRCGGCGVDGSASGEFGCVNPTQGFAVDVGPQNVAAGGGEIAVCVNRKAGLEPVQRSVGGFDGLCISRFGVATSVNGLGPQHVGRCEVVRVEGEGQVRTVERGVKLNDVDAGCVDGLVPEGDLHLRTRGNDVVKLQLNDTAVGKVSEVEGETGVRVVDHQPGVEIVAQQGTVCDHQLAAFLNGYRRTHRHADVGVHGQGCVALHDDMAVHCGVFIPHLIVGNNEVVPALRGCCGSKW